VQKQSKSDRTPPAAVGLSQEIEEAIAPTDTGLTTIGDYRTELLEIIRNLCKGLLQINPLLSVQVVFQSKRYGANTSVTVSQIRDLRGAMAGRTDKGIFITTSTFTGDARKEALREGVPPIELVDGQKLVTMFEELQLGLTPKTVYDVDREFFKEFK
jgi:hypothetical protein